MAGDTHIPVLMRPVLAALAPAPGETVLDCTAGLGGHAAEMAARIGKAGTVVLMDLDAGNLERAAARLRGIPEAPQVLEMHASFAEAPHRLAGLGVRADVMLADLGFASNQVEDAGRGLSFSRDGPLDMRLNPARGKTAADLVATATEVDLERIVRTWGEERHSRRVARAIVEARRETALTTTAALAAVIRRVVPKSPGEVIDPATRTFQALRIAVNDEIGNLDALLAAIEDSARTPEPAWLARGARIGIIAFHSLEDRPVKHAFAALVRRGLATERGEQPARADADEVRANPRARSAKLRAIQLAHLT
ncbi:16S rRNA (cytosine(1402)-N(4))-methyltransferase RsmH [soil metagenome]